MKKAVVKAALVAVVVLAPALAARAHSLSVMVTKVAAKPGSQSVVYLCWGHALPVDELVDAKDIEKFEARSPSGSVVPLRVEGRSVHANEVKLEEPGAYQFGVERKPSNYCIAKGADGKRKFLMGTKAEVKVPEGCKIESSTRSRSFAKAISVVAEGDGEVKPPAPLGHPLEIVPTTDLSKLKVGQPARFRVLLDGKPLAKAPVDATCVATSPDGKPTTTLETDDDGAFELTPSDGGAWVFLVRHDVPAAEADRGRFDSEACSTNLTIGFKED